MNYMVLKDLCTSFWNLSNVNFFSISLKIQGSAEYWFDNRECQQLAASRPDFTKIIRTSSLSSEMGKNKKYKQMTTGDFKPLQGIIIVFNITE